MASVHKLLLAVLLGFLFTAIPGPAVIRFLKRMDFRQSERQEGPPSHQKKAGTPTVGGVFLLLGWLLASLIGVREGFSLVLPVLLVTVLCGLMGFLDDFIKISTGTSMGLLPYQKVLLQFVVSLLAAAWLYRSDAVGSAITLPFSGKSWDLDFFYIPFALFVISEAMTELKVCPVILIEQQRGDTFHNGIVGVNGNEWFALSLTVIKTVRLQVPHGQIGHGYL